MTHSLLISDVFPPRTGGSGRWFWEIYRRLPGTDFVIAAGEDPRQDEFDKTHDLQVVRMPLTLADWGVRSWRGMTGYARAFRHLRRLVRQVRPSCVHAGRVLPEGIMAWCLKRWFGIPYLCYIHGEDVSHTTESRELHWLARRVVAGADRLIANSQNSARIVGEFDPRCRDRVTVLHPGVDTERFRPAPRTAAVRGRLGWGDRRVILTVGRLQKRKGHDQMIRALHRVRKAAPDVLYAILGDGEERGCLAQLAVQEGLTEHVQFLGETSDDDLIAAYQQCDLFALPNRQIGTDIEGFGMVLLEAQACGKPVIAGASGGTAETMDIPSTGCVVDCSTPDLLGPLVTEWLADQPRLERMGSAAREWVVERFDWGALTRAAADVFRPNGATRNSASSNLACAELASVSESEPAVRTEV
jgi:phosphatidylinositol alpha-1,6-mannosyltransferase